MSFNIQSVTSSLTLDGNGIWVSAEQSAVSYPEHANDLFFEIEENSYWYQHRNKIILETLKRYPPAGAFFDIGGGNGFVARGLEQAGYEVVLVEPGPQGALHAKQRGLEQVICSTLEDAGFREDSLPAVGCFDVIEHIEDDVGFANQLRSRLKQGGRLYATVPAHRWLWSSEDVGAGHFRRHTIASMKHLVEQAGFELEFASYFFSHLVMPIFLLRTVPAAVGLRKPFSADSTKSEHRTPTGMLGRMFTRWEKKELERLQRGQANTWYGSSCLVVARKR
ncbi:MAG: class I SAM-dependent methyltransferase [Gemmatales bacterium]